MSVKAIVHASELITGSGVRKKDGRKIIDSDLNRIPDGALVYDTRTVSKKEIPHRVLWVGKTSDLPSQYLNVSTTDLKNENFLMPGLVDCHNHLVFHGDRSEEFALRCQGVSYEEIARRGGGIASTVAQTRSASVDELRKSGAKRVREAYSRGVRTLEVKTGYGLSVESELRLLEVIRLLEKDFPEITFSKTFLGAHAFPKEKSRKAYLDELVNEALPQIAKEKWADACDVFVDEGYFTVDEARLLLSRAKQLGLGVKVHADELVGTGSTELAVELEALSADHLLKISRDGISKIAASQTVAVLLPGTAFYLKAEYAPARALIEAGACVALATDYNPGSCVCNNLPAIMTMAALHMGMSAPEIFAAVTYNGAKALGLHGQKGTLEVGKDADFYVGPFQRFEGLYYHFAWSP